MVDGAGLAFVAVGTLAATVLQCGWRDAWLSARVISGLFRPAFDPARAKAELAHQIEEIRTDGLLRAEPQAIGDEEIDDATGALIAARSSDVLLARHASYRERRAATTEKVRRVLGQASELAPVLGLAGTLLALSGLAGPSGAGAPGGAGLAGAIGTAVATTFYGLVIAHAVFVPLAGMVERRAWRQDIAREEVFAWLEQQVRQAEPRCIRVAQQQDAAA